MVSVSFYFNRLEGFRFSLENRMKESRDENYIEREILVGCVCFYL